MQLTEQGCQSRRRRMWERLPEEIEWVLIADPRHVQYLANFWVQPLSFSGGERGLLLLERSGAATLMGDNFAIRSAAHKPFVDEEVLTPWYDHKHSVINRDHALLQALQQVAPRLKGRTGAVESEWLSVAAAKCLEPPHEAEVGSLLRHLRRQKEPDEVALMKHCMQAGDAGQAWMRENLRVGLSEFDIYRGVQEAAVKAAGRPALVYGDFRAANAKLPKTGGLPTDYILQSGDLFVLDYSVVLDGYRSDFTNTMAVGEPSSGVQTMFALCQAGMAAGEQVLKAGVAAKNVHAAVAGPFRDAGRPELFPHHAGHGLGLGHPEPPILVPDSTDVLMAGDVITLEPGAYEEGKGGMRIEHNYLITDAGYERLSNHVISLT
ncbi:MAG: aminopeptidase P family protein [Planctomycetaceae bacterium]|nr:aminopeptidase P family protein [Planctomycetaceae bacterium]